MLVRSHTLFVADDKACLLTRSYDRALPLIREIYTDVKTVSCRLISRARLNEKGSCGYLDIIIFYHHAGLIAAATQDFPLAVELFSIVSPLDDING